MFSIQKKINLLRLFENARFEKKASESRLSIFKIENEQLTNIINEANDLKKGALVRNSI